MNRRRPAPAQDLARRFLQLDTDIQLAAAAGGLPPFFQDDRPESPARQYQWDAQIQHPRPRPANGPILIRQLENVAKTKPKPTRSVSDPGDARRLIARFVKSNEEKARSMTVAITEPSPDSSAPSSSVHTTRGSASGTRAFPFPSMARQATLENFLEIESSANETGQEDPLALKMGQILARRAAAATRTISRRSGGSRSSSRAGFGGATLAEMNKLASELDKDKGKQVEQEQGESKARPRPPPLDMPGGAAAGGRHAKRESVVIDDRSPHEGQPFWARVVGSSVSIAPGSSASVARGSKIFAPEAPVIVYSVPTITTDSVLPDPTTSSLGPRNEPQRERNISFSASHDSLRSFVFPALAPEPEMETHVQVQVQTPVRTQFQVQSQTPVRAQFQVQTQSPFQHAQPQSPFHHVHTQSQPSPVRAHFQSAQSPRTPIRVQTSQIRPVSFIVEASPSSGVFVSPVDSVSWAMGAGGASPTAYRASPTTAVGTGYRVSPMEYRASPTGYRASPTPRATDAHVNLLRGLTPLPSRGLPLPAPIRPHSFNLLDPTGANLPRRFSVTLPPPEPVGEIAPSPKTPSPPVATSSPPRRVVPSPPRQSPPRQVAPSPPRRVAPSPPRQAAPSPPRRTGPSPPRRSTEATPMAAPALVASPSPLPMQHTFPTMSPDLVPTRALSPLPPRLRHHTNASQPSDGSGSDEVVYTGRSSSPSPARRRRRSRPRRAHARANSDGLVRRTMSEGMQSKRMSEGGVPRLTGQALARRRPTGNGDAGEVSSDGRDEVVFRPRGPPPPVPRVPTPLATQVMTLPTANPPTPPAVVAAAPVPPPLVRKESIPLPESSPTQLGPPGVPAQTETVPSPVDEPPSHSTTYTAEAAPTQSSEPTRESSLDLFQPSLPRHLITRAPWSPLGRVLSREGSFYTAPDSFVEDAGVDTDAEFPSSVPGSFPDVSYMDDGERARLVNTPPHMDLSELEEGDSPMLSAEEGSLPRQDIPERATISSAMRGHVSQPAILTRQSSREFVRIPSEIPSPPRSNTPARRTGREGMLSGAFQQGFLVPPLAPSPSSGSSRTPHSHAHTASILMRHDSASPPSIEHLPRSVTPRTPRSPPTETSGSRHPEEDSFQSAHTADDVLRLPLDDWLEFAMSSMAAMGIPLTRSTLEDLHESEDEVAVVAEALSNSSMRGVSEEDNNGGFFDGVSQADDDSDDDSPSQSLSDVSGTPSPTHSNSGLFSGPGFGDMTTFTTAAPESTATRPTIQTTDLEFPTDNPLNLSASATTDDDSDSERAVDSLQNIAVVVREMNARTPLPSGGSSRALPSASTSLPMHTPFSGPGSHMGSTAYLGPPIPGAYQDPLPARALSPGAVSISFLESTPTLSTSVPPLVVLSEDRDRFAHSLLIAEYQQQRQHQHSLRNLRDDDYRALDEGEDVVLYAGIGGDWERIERSRIRTESHGTAGSGVPIEFADYDPESNDPQSQRKYTQFLLSLANALRPPNVNRPQRWVEVALRALRAQAPTSRQSELYDAISRVEAGLEPVPPPPAVPSHLSSTFLSSSSSSTPKSSSIGSALPEDDQLVEEFVRNILDPSTPARTPPPQSVTPIRTDTASLTPNAIPWPVLASPVLPRYLFARSSSRSTARTPLTSSSSSRSGYSSLIPPLPRPRARTIEPHWLAIYMARRWALAQNHVTRRTYSSPSALGPPMPYHWRPICHISPERLWEITNLAVRVDMPPPPAPPALSVIESVSPVEIARPHYTTPATTYGRATPYSARTGSSHRSRRTTTPAQRPLSALVPIYPEATTQMTSHPNLPINPSHHSVGLQTTTSRTTIPLVQRPLDAQYAPRTSTSSERPSQTAVVSGAVTPAGVQRKRTVRDLVGRLIGKERTRVRSISHSRSPSPLVSKSRFGLVGRVTDVARRVLRHPRRRARVSSIRSQRAQAVRDA